MVQRLSFFFLLIEKRIRFCIVPTVRFLFVENWSRRSIKAKNKQKKRRPDRFRQ